METTPNFRSGPAASPPRHRVVLAVCALFTVLGGPSAHAQVPTASSSDAFRAADADGDGRLSEEEFKKYGTEQGAEREEPGQGIPATKHQAQVMRNFKQEDLNGDGYISQDELQQSK